MQDGRRLNKCRSCEVAAAHDWKCANPREYLVGKARIRARHLGVPFRLVPSDIYIPDWCPVLDYPLGFGDMYDRCHHNSPSIDRVVPELGYVPENVWVISARANAIKGDRPMDNTYRLALKDYVNNATSQRQFGF